MGAALNGFYRNAIGHPNRIDELLTLKKSACDAELKLGSTNNAAATLTLKQI